MVTDSAQDLKREVRRNPVWQTRELSALRPAGVARQHETAPPRSNEHGGAEVGEDAYLHRALGVGSRSALHFFCHFFLVCHVGFQIRFFFQICFRSWRPPATAATE